MKFRFHTISTISLVLLASSVLAAPDGEALYEEHCSVCHGQYGKGGVGVPLALASFINSVSDDYIFRTIRHGRPGRIMPAFEELSDAQVLSITRYVSQWRDGDPVTYDDKPITGNAVNGKRIYEDRCQQCHGKEGAGGTGTGVTFSRKRDLPIIAPAIGNSGFLKSASDSMILSTIKHGRKGTPMTKTIAQGLSDSDLGDLVSYIRSLESVKPHSTQLDDVSPVLMYESPYGMKETVENLKQSIAGQNFMLIRVEELDKTLVSKGAANANQMILHFCNFNFLFKALAIDPRVGLFLPCRITVLEHEGKVLVMAVNTHIISKLFNNDELVEVCTEMYETYKELIEDAVL